MKQPDILLFMSDQHGADYCSWGDVKVDTPTLDALHMHWLRPDMRRF